MNSLRFNGGTLNGSRVVAALAFISCAATAEISAAATYVHSSVATVVAGASVTASSSGKQFGSSSDFIGNAYFLVKPTHTHGGSSDVVGSANLVGYSLRYIGASADFLGMATATFVPADSFGTCNFVSTAGFNAEATKVQFGKGNSIGESFVTLTEPVVIRYVMGNVLGSGGLYAETRINGVHEAYANPESLSSVEISDEGLVIKQVGALITGQAFVNSAETYIYSTKSNVVSFSEVTADATLTTGISGHVVGTTSVVAEATYFSISSLVLTGTANVTNSAVSINHAATGQNVINTAGLLAIATSTITTGTASIPGSSSISARGTYVYISGSDLICSAQIEVLPNVNYAVHSNVTASVIIEAAPIVPVPFRAYGDMASSAELEATATVYICSSADFVGTGFLNPIGYKNITAPVASFRAFIRPKSLREFTRLSDIKSFKR